MRCSGMDRSLNIATKSVLIFRRVLFRVIVGKVPLNLTARAPWCCLRFFVGSGSTGSQDQKDSGLYHCRVSGGGPCSRSMDRRGTGQKRVLDRSHARVTVLIAFIWNKGSGRRGGRSLYTGMRNVYRFVRDPPDINRGALAECSDRSRHSFDRAR